ncbi:oligosaccharide flippase family protein [Seonamhaeicola sp.]|uniref:lipopolysaccharide biosynthesis protein n=1 Tax=Seonamhaeicola sp. TaxID=1912245 RepID=UPI00261FC38C|nr:oligosaccharide flippase family protein [Seonamhaeicola sp.]
MNRILEKIKLLKSEFVRNVLLVMTGTAISQGIGLIMTPILTRNYSPEHFGVLLVYMSILTIVGTISTGKYERAILLTKTEKDISKIVFLCFFISLGVSFVLFIALLTCSNLIVNYLSFELSLYNWLYTLPILLIVYSLYVVFSMVLNYQKKFKALSTAKIVKTISSISVSLACIFFLKDARGLILGEFSGYTLSMLFVYCSNKNNLVFNTIGVKEIKEIAVRYKDFPRFNIPSDFMNMTSSQMPAFFLTTYFGAGVTGFYSLMKRVLDAPVGLLSTSVLEVFRQKAAAQYMEQGNCKYLFVKTAKSLGIISVIPFTLIFLFAPQLFAFIFGSEWEIAGEYSRIFSMYYYFKFVSSPLTYMFYIAEKQKIDFILHLYIFCSVILILNLPRFFDLNEANTLWIYSINYVIVYSFYFIFSYRLACGKEINNYLKK